MSDISEQIRNSLQSQSAVSQSIEHQNLEFKKFLATEANDSLYDLTEEQMHAISCIREGDEVIFAAYGGLPRSRKFTAEFCSLSRSRRRLGRIEGVGLGSRPINPTLVPYRSDIEDEREYKEAAMREQSGGWFGWLRGK